VLTDRVKVNFLSTKL